MGRITPIMNYIRRVLVEEVYGRLSKALRPQTTVHWILTRVKKASCSPIRRPGWPALTSRPTTFNNRYVPLT
jgi:hypothetical protein